MGCAVREYSSMHCDGLCRAAPQCREVARLRAEVELERMRNVACGVAAMGNTPDSVAQRIGKDNPYHSASYSDVCHAVDREIALRAEVGRLELARDGLCRLMHRTDVSEEARELAADYYRQSSKLSAQPAPEKPGVYPECPECGGTSWELETSGSATRHCADCGAEIQPFSADELARSEKVVKRVMLTITPCGYGCKDGKDGGEIWINEACPTHSRAVGFNDSIGTGNICQPAPEKPGEPAGGKP